MSLFFHTFTCNKIDSNSLKKGERQYFEREGDDFSHSSGDRGQSPEKRVDCIAHRIASAFASATDPVLTVGGVVLLT